MSKSSTPSDFSNANEARLLDLEVDPLPEQRWSKIEQAVFARLDATAFEPLPRVAAARGGARRFVVWSAAAAVLGLFVLALMAAGVFERVTDAAALSRISTGRTGSHVALPGLSLDVSPESAVVVSGSAQESTLIVVDRGEIACDVAHRRPGAPLVVQAGEVRVEVVGTRFVVTRQGETARVAVQEGVVKVSSRGHTVAVRAGASWPEPVAVSRVAPAEPVSLLALPLEESAQLRPRAPRAVAPRGSPAEAAEVVESVPAPEPSELQQQFETATRLERSDPSQAIQLYRQLENGGNSWAKNALFAHGRLEAARGNRGEARRILGQYLTRFPQGANAEDARILLGRLE